MLKKVRIKNFLSCEDTEFDLEQITVLIGRNAAGKSNVLKTIQYFCNFIVGKDNFLKYFPQNNITIIFEFIIDNKVFKYVLEGIWGEYKITENFSYYENDEWVTVVERKEKKAFYFDGFTTEFNINIDVSVIEAIITFFPDENIDFFVKSITQFCSQINYYTLENKKDFSVVMNSEYLQWLSHKNDSIVMKLLHSYRENKEILNELQELLGNNGLNLIGSIGVFEIGNSDTYLYDIVFNVKKTRVNYNDLSYGTQRVLMILLALLYDKSTTLLIEQPEDGIHLGLLRKVLSICFTYAEAYNKQLIISTHSPKVINMFPAKSIRFVKMTEQGTKVTQLSEKELAIIPEYLNNEGTLSDFIEAMDDE